MERVTGIEPALSAWEAEVLPLNYTRVAPVDVRPRCVRKSNPDSGRLRKSISAPLAVSVPVLWRVHDASSCRRDCVRYTRSRPRTLQDAR